MNIHRWLAALTCGLALTSQAHADAPKTVTYYAEHNDERKTVLTRCRDNPGELRETPDCVNAERADAKKALARRGHLDLKPLTAEDFKKP
ncbi:EexN family lipoprotein [Xanthomonas hortorum]|uniref:EexN family lipoprotein n=1 Tax=Xanthomonas hortorum TaxID=56454 RepID=UPI001F1C9A81|nr:EexN family lipoprotein [Xanthomonas hortorum]MCE4551929.1 EexN family lipoprotein [Xanthomonas hortorum pv. vitians]